MSQVHPVNTDPL
jgi:aldehyde dehydrogenase (NAD+)